MKLQEKLRRSAFWMYDRLKGSKIGLHYGDIRFSLESRNRELVMLKQRNHLQTLLNHAVESTPFYRKFGSYRSIEDFPIINKSTIKGQFDDFLSEKYIMEKLYKVTTSGSTGAPLTVYHDKLKRVRHQADNIYFLELAGYPIGSRLYYLRVWNDLNRKGFVQRLIQNIRMEDASNLSEERFEQLLEKLKRDNSTKSLLAFSSTYEAFSHFMAKGVHPVPCKVSTIITMSETLPEGAKEILKRAFNCPVVSRYSNMENGFLAQQCISENNEYHLNEASYYFELLHPERDVPVDVGQLGRVVVTDLFNFALPMIRYDTGDMAILENKSLCGRPGRVFRRVEGRKVDFIYDTQGNLLSPHIITNSMWKYSSEVRQFQFIQNGQKSYVVRLNCPHNVFTKNETLLSELLFYLGDDAIIHIEFVNEIPLLASGKRKKIVNNYY